MGKRAIKKNFKNMNLAAEKTEIEQPSMGSLSKIRALVALNNKKNLEVALTFLEQNHYDLKIVTTIPELIEGLKKHRPHIVLVSWNLRQVNVRKLHRLLTENFKLSCVVFAEENNTRTTTSLMASGIPNSLLAPVSGATLYGRVQSIVSSKRKRRKPLAPDLAMVPSKISGDKSEAKPDNITSVKEEFLFIKGKEKETTEKTEEQGPHLSIAPSNNLFEEGEFDWDGTLEKMRSAFEDIQKGDLSSDEEGPSNEQTGTPKRDFKSDSNQKIGSQIRGRNRRAVESVLAQALRAALRRCPGPARSEIHDQLEISRVALCPIQSQRYCGYLVCANAQNEHSRTLIEELMGILSEEMDEQGETLFFPPSIINMEIESTPFMPWADQKADFVVTSPNSSLAVAFFPTDGHPEFLEAKVDSVLGISLTKDVKPDAVLTFNAYIYLEKNNKYLLYVAQGQAFSQKTIDRFVKFGVTTIYIRKEEKELFLAYCAKNFIQTTLK